MIERLSPTQKNWVHLQRNFIPCHYGNSILVGGGTNMEIFNKQEYSHHSTFLNFIHELEIPYSQDRPECYGNTEPVLKHSRFSFPWLKLVKIGTQFFDTTIETPSTQGKLIITPLLHL